MLKHMILEKYHKKPYVGHLGYQKMITTLRKSLFSPGMKKYVVKYLAKCLECQQVKVEHQHHAWLLNPLPIPKWNWEIISVDFTIGLLIKMYQHDSIMVVVDTLTKEKHFILV